MRTPLPAKTLNTTDACNTSVQKDGIQAFATLHRRAYEALDHFSTLNRNDFHLYVSGPSGVGKHYNTRMFLQKNLPKDTHLRDLVYINNFDDPDKPVAVMMEAGSAKTFAKAVDRHVKEARRRLEQMFQSNEYLFKKRDIEAKVQQKQQDLFFEVVKEAKKDDLQVQYDQNGYSISPVNKEGKVLSKKEYDDLSSEQKEKIRNDILYYKQQIDTASSKVLQYNTQAADALEKLEQDSAQKVVQAVFEPLQKQYGSNEKLARFLNDIQSDMQARAGEFMPRQSEQTIFAFDQEGDVSMYGVNVLVDNAALKNVPVVYEHNPTYTNMFGVVEYASQMGALVTDFSHIKPGSLHKANGGYLILDAQKVLFAPYVWEGLKRMLQTKQCSIDTINDELGLGTAQTLRPEPVDLDIKVVLIGSSDIYYMLSAYDDEFGKLFPMHADFHTAFHPTKENISAYLGVAESIGQGSSLLPVGKSARQVLLHRGMKQSLGGKISAGVQQIRNLLIQADTVAKSRGDTTIEALHLDRAVAHERFYNNRLQQQVYDAIGEGTILLDFSGFVSGQVNGLSYVSVGKEAFGEPVKITALTRMGKGEVVDIQRQVDLGGSIHSKGVMTLAGFIGYKYARDMVLSMHASISFEQSYGEVDGDSASLAELIAILSSLSGFAIDQSFGVTGSINQRGQIQPVGGINEKIEGYFDVCQRVQSTNNAVVIPAQNTKDLMLKQTVVDAVRQGSFAVYAVESIPEAVELLTHKPATEVDEAVVKTLHYFAQKAKQKRF